MRIVPFRPGKPATAGLFPSDTWCALDEPDDHFYDNNLATATIARLAYAAAKRKKDGTPFFIQAGFARPHAPWRVPQRFWVRSEPALCR